MGSGVVSLTLLPLSPLSLVLYVASPPEPEDTKHLLIWHSVVLLLSSSGSQPQGWAPPHPSAA